MAANHYHDKKSREPYQALEKAFIEEEAAAFRAPPLWPTQNSRKRQRSALQQAPIYRRPIKR